MYIRNSKSKYLMRPKIEKKKEKKPEQFSQDTL